MDAPVHMLPPRTVKSSKTYRHNCFGDERKISSFIYEYWDDSGEEYFPWIDKTLEIERALLNDDDYEFVELVNGTVDGDWEVPELTLEWMFEFDAVKCLAAVLEGKTRGCFDIHKQSLFAGCSKLPLLHLASYFSSVGITKLLLDLDYSGVGVDEGCEIEELLVDGLLPLQLALRALWFEMPQEHLDLSNQKGTIFRLVHNICVPYKRNALEVVRLLAQRTTKVKEVFLNYVEDGALKKVAALLLVAKEKVMPEASEVRDIIVDKLATLLVLRSTPFRAMIAKPNPEALKQMMDEELVMKAMLMLVDIFEMLGSALSAYIQLDPKELTDDEVAVQIGCIFKSAGLHVDDAFIRSFGRYCPYHAAVISSYKGKCDHASKRDIECRFLSRMQRKMESATEVILNFQLLPRVGICGQRAHSASYHTLRSVEACNEFGSTAQLKGMHKLMPNTRCISHYAFFMTALKRAVRCI